MTTVVKIGGNVVDDPEALDAFLGEFAALEGRKILVHGGGKEATRMSAALGIETKMIDGRRVTDAETIGVCTMVYAGLVGKRIVARLQALGVNAIGLTGADGGAIRATRRPSEPVDYGFVGDLAPEAVGTAFIGSLLDLGLTPVFSAIMYDGAATLLNCNADSVAATLAIAMKARLVYCFEKAGVLADVSDDSSVIPLITPSNYARLRASGAVSGGMIPKVDGALHAIASGATQVEIKNALNLLQPYGTTIRPE